MTVDYDKIRTIEDVFYQCSIDLLENPDPKRTEIAQRLQDLITIFSNTRTEINHQGGTDIERTEKLNNMVLNDFVHIEATNNDLMTKYDSANLHGFTKIYNGLKPINREWGDYKGPKNIISFLQWISAIETPSTSIVKAIIKVPRIVPMHVTKDNLKHDELISKFDYTWKVAYGNYDCRNKILFWLQNFENTRVDFSDKHREKLNELNEEVQGQIAIIDDSSTDHEESERAMREIKRIWDEKYQSFRRKMQQQRSPLFVNKESLVNNNKRTSTKDKISKTQSPPEKKRKQHTTTQNNSECGMCKLMEKTSLHKPEKCWYFDDDAFDGKKDSIKELPKEESDRRKAEYKLQRKNKSMKTSNYSEAYIAQQSLNNTENHNPVKDQPIYFLNDTGATTNIVRRKDLFSHISKINAKINGLGSTHFANLGGIVEVYAKTHEGRSILLRFDAIYIPATSDEDVNIISTSRLVQGAFACHCFGHCQNMCGNINPNIEDSLTAMTTAGDTIRLHTTKINNTSRIEVQRNGPEDSQVVDFSYRQITDDALKARETEEDIPEEIYDSEEEIEAYRSSRNAEEYLDEELNVYTVTYLPDTKTSEEKDIERTRIIPQQPISHRDEISKKITPKWQEPKNTPSSAEQPPTEEEIIFAKRTRDKDRATEIHQRHGHMHYQKIADSMSKCVHAPKIPEAVLHELKNLRCVACDLTRNYQERHPKSKFNTPNRATAPGQCVKVDVFYAPNRFKSANEKRFLNDLTFDQKGTQFYKKNLPTVSIEDHVAKIGFGAPWAIVFVDEFSRWTTVLPLRTLREDEFIAAFTMFKDELTKMIHKYQKNVARQADGTAQHATNKSNFELFTYETRVQEILTDKQTGMFKSEKFKEFMRTFWSKKPESKEEPFFTESVLQFVPRDKHAHNGIAERKIRTLKEKAMVSLMTAFGDKTLADLDSFVYTYWFSAVKHAAMISNLMSITVKGKAEVSPYTHITGKIFPMSQLYPFFARASAIVQSKHDNNFERRRKSSRIKKPTERASQSTSNDRQNKASKALPYINREKVRYLYTDLSSSIIQPVVLNEDAWEINKHALTYFQNADHMKNIVVKAEVDIDARSFINLNPTNQPTLEQIKNYSSYKALLYPEGERRTTDMEDLEVFLGFEVPRAISLPDPAQRRDEQHSGQAPGAEALNNAEDVEEESATCSEVYYCPSVQDDELDIIIKHNHIDTTLSDMEENTNKTKEYSAYAINCESNNFNPYEVDREFMRSTSIHGHYPHEPLWAYAVSRINSESGELTKRRTISEFSQQEIKAAIKKEVDGIHEKEVLQHVPSDEWRTMWKNTKPPKTCETRIVLAVKENGELKARLVAKGFRQRPGENYFQTFSPVVDRTSVHTILNIAAIKGLPLYSLDVSQAFLQAPIDEDVYIKYEGEIYKLKKALYGTKQASRMWNMELTKTLLSYGLQQCKTDPCVFVKFEETQSKIEESQPKFEKLQPTVFVCVSTDDLLVATENEHWRKLAAYLSHDYQGRFKTSHADMEKECTSFNGIEIKRENAHKYSINLNTYTQQLLLEYDTAYTNMKPKADIPAYGRQVYDNFTPEEKKACTAKEIKEYQSIVGQITWLSTNTRPDLVHFTASASRAAKDPNKGQLKILRRIIGYLKMTPNRSITFDGNGINEIRIEAFTDAGESTTAFSASLPTSNLSHSKHTSGYVISMGSGALAWKSKLQPRVSSSICQGEYMAAELCLHEVKFIHDLLADVGFPQTHTFMFIDNQASINLMLNNTSLKKHDRTTIHVLQESVDDRVIIPIYIPSKLNVSDMFTKANAAKIAGQDKELIQMINGSKLDAVDYRKHIETIVNNNYIKTNKISEFPTAEILLKHVSESHRIGKRKNDEPDFRFPKKQKNCR